MTAYDGSGTALWQLGGTGAGSMIAAPFVTADESLLVAGQLQGVLSLALDEEPTQISSPCISGDSGSVCGPALYDMLLDQDGAAFHANASQGTVGNRASFAGAAPLATGGYLIGGTVTGAIGFDGEESTDIWLATAVGSEPVVAAFDEDGEPIWAARLGESFDEGSAAGIAASSDGTFHVAGTFSGQAQFRLADASPASLTAGGQTDGFLLHACP